MDAALAFLIKLPLAIFVFLLIAYAGTVSRRIAGVLFTFPILNGIAIIASPDPVRVAAAIYPLVIFNCVLFAALLSFPRALPPVGSLPAAVKLVVRIAIWSLAWLAGAYAITDVSASIPGGSVLFAGAAIFALVLILGFWSASPPDKSTTPHGKRFAAFWMNETGLWRIAFFVGTFACLYFASRTASDEKWVGMASALPLPGLFALATLIDQAERDPAARHAVSASLAPIRDTLFLGPLLVIPFNWTFSHALSLVPDHALPRYLLLLAMWAVAAYAVLRAVPWLAACLDRRNSITNA